jgi:hypothetical protein
VKKDKRKIVIIGDSHARNCAAELHHRLGKKCAVSGYVKPGAGMEVIVQSWKEEIEKLSGEDIVVVWGGSNDIGKQNPQEALSQVCKFVDRSQDVHVIVMSAPHRHDLMPSSCVKVEVARFNCLLRKRMKLYKRAKILDTDLNRDCFTKHGLHMNSSGKEQLILKLADMIESLTIKNSGSSIQLQWKENGTSLDNIDSVQILGIGGCTPPVANQVPDNDGEVVKP